MGGFPILTILTFAPLAGAFLIMIVRGLTADQADATTGGKAMSAGLVITAGAFLLSLVVFAFFDPQADGYQMVEDQPWFGGIKYKLGVDGISMPLILLTTFLTPICIIASWGVIKDRVTEYVVSFLVLETMMIGVFTALDLVLFYFFFEAGLIPMFVIIGVWGGKERLYAAFKFFLYTLLGSLFMLAAIVYIYVASDSTPISAYGETLAQDLYFNAFGERVETTDIEAIQGLAIPGGAQTWLFLAFFASFAVKLPMWPVHTWLPDAHVQAPTAGSVILAGVLLKMGAYGFLRFSLPMFPEASLYFQPMVFALSVIAILYASLVAFRQTDMKKLIAYSSVAHMGFVTLGIFAFNEAGVQGAMFQMLSHGLISSALFLIVGVVYDRMHTREIAAYGGLSLRMPIYATVFMLFAMANVGLPGTSGFVGEIMSMVGGFQASRWAAVGAALGVIFSAVYMLTLYRRVTFGEITNPEVQALQDVSAREMATLAPLAAGTLLFGIAPWLIFNFTETGVGRVLALFGEA